MAASRRRILGFAPLLALLVSVPAHAQTGGEASPDPGTGSGLQPSATAAVGVGSEDLYAHATFAVSRGGLDYLLRVSGSVEIFGVDNPAASIALMAGPRWGGTPGSWLRLAAGPARVDTGICDDISPGLCQGTSTTAGLELGADAGAGFRWFGLTLGLHGNLNPERSWTGLALGLHLGPIGYR